MLVVRIGLGLREPLVGKEDGRVRLDERNQLVIRVQHDQVSRPATRLVRQELACLLDIRERDVAHREAHLAHRCQRFVDMLFQPLLVAALRTQRLLITLDHTVYEKNERHQGEDAEDAHPHRCEIGFTALDDALVEQPLPHRLCRERGERPGQGSALLRLTSGTCGARVCGVRLELVCSAVAKCRRRAGVGATGDSRAGRWGQREAWDVARARTRKTGGDAALTDYAVSRWLAVDARCSVPPLPEPAVRGGRGGTVAGGTRVKDLHAILRVGDGDEVFVSVVVHIAGAHIVALRSDVERMVLPR
mmetsp:Transcript_44824/g.132404  ORF Transcript_44824/g.132404 Transcript_44824/m.132404 type:complete len:304 (+) Transcript_44824:2628-3539(+)